jgi:hypothetical protein
VIHPPVTFPEQDCVFEHCKKVKNNKENIYLPLKSSSVYLFSATLYMLIFVLLKDGAVPLQPSKAKPTLSSSLESKGNKQHCETTPVLVYNFHRNW